MSIKNGVGDSIWYFSTACTPFSRLDHVKALHR
jgi:hypothetical protein